MLSCIVVSTLTGCTHKIVDSNELGDCSMSCDAIYNEIKKIETQEAALQAEHGLTFKNFLFAIVSPSFTLANEQNITAAQQALIKRKATLVKMFEEKSCSAHYSINSIPQE